MAVIELSHVTKIYRRGFRATKVPAVTDVSFSVEPRRVVGFVGPNGAGKTTCLKMLMGLVRPSSGVVRLNGIDSSVPSARTGVAYVSEQPYFYGHLNVVESLQFCANLLRMRHESIAPAIGKALDAVELSGRERLRVREMSKGMQQRLNMAQALLGDASVYLLDEPMSGMDPPGRRLFRKLFRELAQNGKSIFFSTHVLDDVESVCDEVIVLSKGRLEYSGSVAELLRRGFTGTELHVSHLDDILIERLTQHGYSVEQDSGGHIVTVSAGGDVELCQRLLAAADRFCTRMTVRSMSLEQLLYDRHGSPGSGTDAPRPASGRGSP